MIYIRDRQKMVTRCLVCRTWLFGSMAAFFSPSRSPELSNRFLTGVLHLPTRKATSRPAAHRSPIPCRDSKSRTTVSACILFLTTSLPKDGWHGRKHERLQSGTTTVLHGFWRSDWIVPGPFQSLI